MACDCAFSLFTATYKYWAGLLLFEVSLLFFWSAYMQRLDRPPSVTEYPAAPFGQNWAQKSGQQWVYGGQNRALPKVSRYDRAYIPWCLVAKIGRILLIIMSKKKKKRMKVYQQGHTQGAEQKKTGFRWLSPM